MDRFQTARGHFPGSEGADDETLASEAAAVWQEMQGQVTALSERYPTDRMRRWVFHWDRQVYKVLEAAYCTGLETLNESLQLPDSLRVELGFFHNTEPGALQFKPSLEEIRSVYYRELKKFVSVPNAFKGLNGHNGEVVIPESSVRPFVNTDAFALGL